MATKTQNTTTKTTKSTAKVSTKAVNNTPAKAKSTSKAKPQAIKVFSLIAGLTVSISNKHLAKAISYHVKKGNLTKVDAGVKLTQQGADCFKKERQENNPEQFQKIAAFMHDAKADIPGEWNRQPVCNVADNVRFPNMLYWGSFSGSMMRQAFAAIWAK